MARAKVKHPVLAKSPTTTHVALAEYATKKTGVEVDPNIVKIIEGIRPEFRNSPERVAEREAAKAARDAKLAEQLKKAEAKAAQLRARLSTAPVNGADEDEADEDEADEEPEVKVTPAKKGKAKAEPVAEPVAEDEDEDDEDWDDEDDEDADY